RAVRRAALPLQMAAERAVTDERGSPSGHRSATRFSETPCSSSAFSPASTNANPSVELTACVATSAGSPLQPLFVIDTNVVPSGREVKSHSIVVGVPYPGHSTRIRRFSSTALTSTGIVAPYISHVHSTCSPASSLPLPFVNQNLDVRAGSTKAAKTSATGRRISISALATIGSRLICSLRQQMSS